ncbi:MAG TPA: VWA domain-containing protein [Bacillota bacterium]|nr:VWA domain-containing protein [Bacillota bacterium]
MKRKLASLLCSLLMLTMIFPNAWITHSFALNKAVSIDQGNQLSMKVGDTITLDATSTVNGTLKWNVLQVGNVVNLSKVDQNSVKVKALAQGIVVVTVRHDNGINTPDDTCLITIGPAAAPSSGDSTPSSGDSSSSSGGSSSSPSASLDATAKPQTPDPGTPNTQTLSKSTSDPVVGNLEFTLTPQGTASDAQRKPVDVVFVLDGSGSMASDNKWSSALSAIKNAIGKFSPTIHDRLGLVVFNDRIIKTEQLTDNFTTINQDIASLPNPNNGTNYAIALQNALDLFDSTSGDRRRYVIFLTDGKPTVYTTKEDVTYSTWFSTTTINTDVKYQIAGSSAPFTYQKLALIGGYWFLVESKTSNTPTAVAQKIQQSGFDVASSLSDEGVNLFSIGVGNSNSDLDMNYLSQLTALSTGGKSFQASDASAIADQYNQIVNAITNPTLSNIQLSVKLPDNATTTAAPIVNINNQNYVQMNVDPIKYPLSISTIMKELSIQFPDVKNYTFDDIKLTYQYFDNSTVQKTIVNSSNPIIFKVQGPDTKSSNAFLSNLNLSEGSLNPPFTKSVKDYTVTVQANTTSITETPTVEDTGKATVTVNGVSVVSGGNSSPIDISGSHPVIKTIVTAEDGTQTNPPYTVTVNHKPSANSIPNVVTNVGVQQTIDLSGTFADADGDSLQFSVNANDSSIAQVSISAGKVVIDPIAAGSTSVTVAADDGNGGTVFVTFTVTVNSQSGNDYLSNLVIDGGTLSPTFNKETQTYTVNVPGSLTTTTVTPTVEDVGKATVKVGETPVGSGTASGPIDIRGSHPTILVTVTAENGSSTKVYTVQVNHLPVINSISDMSTLMGVDKTVDVSGIYSDADHDSVTLNVQSSDPTIATANLSDGVITLTPVQVGTTTITVKADDGVGGTTQTTFGFTVKPVPQPDFSLSQVGIVGDYLLVRITPNQDTIMDGTSATSTKYITKWYTGDGNWIQGQGEFATGKFVNRTLSSTLEKNMDDNGVIHFVTPQTVSIKAVTYDATTMQEVTSNEKPLDVNFNNAASDENGPKPDSSWFHPYIDILDSTEAKGNRAVKVDMYYNLNVPKSVRLDPTNPNEFKPTFVIKDQSGNTVLTGDLATDGVVNLADPTGEVNMGKKSTHTIKYIKSSSGYTELYKAQIELKMTLTTGDNEELPLTFYSDPEDIKVISKEALQ